MGVKERRVREKEETKASILATAWQMAKEEGWHSLSIRKIADAIEYSAPVIYDHFENKEAILREFVGQGFELLSKKLGQAKEKHTDPGEQLKAMADAYWNFALKNKEYYQLMFGVGMASCDEKKSDNGCIGFNDHIWDSIEAMMSKSKKTENNVCLKYHTFWSILHGLVSIKIMGNSSADRELNKMVLDDAVEGFLRNLK